MAQNKVATILEEAGKEFKAVPFGKSGRRNGNISKGIQKKLEANLIEAGCERCDAHSRAATLAYETRFKSTEQASWEPAVTDCADSDKKIIEAWKENNAGKPLGLRKLFKSN